MQLTLRSNHAMRLLMYCALTEHRAAPVPEIAAACNMSVAHLAKIAHFLAGLGVVETVRGRAGGVRLARPAEQLNVGAIVRATETGRCLVECLDQATNSCPLASVCRFRTVLGRALEAFFSVLDGYTLADLVSDQQGLRQVLGLEALQSH